MNCTVQEYPAWWSGGSEGEGEDGEDLDGRDMEQDSDETQKLDLMNGGGEWLHRSDADMMADSSRERKSQLMKLKR